MLAILDTHSKAEAVARSGMDCILPAESGPFFNGDPLGLLPIFKPHGKTAFKRNGGPPQSVAVFIVDVSSD